MKILFYYTFEYTQRSGCRLLLETEASLRGHDFFTYYNELGNLNKIPFKPDIIITRTSVSGTEEDYKIIESFSNIPVINSANSCRFSADKSVYYPMLLLGGVNVPNFLIFQNNLTSQNIIQIKDIVRFPLVLKFPISSQGREVYLIKDEFELKSFFEKRKNIKVILQKFVSESSGRDIRSFVAGGKVIAAYNRTAKKDDFRTNLALGGIASSIPITKEIEEISLASSKILGLDVAGIDLLYGKDKFYVCDVNAAPALEIMSFTGVNAAAKIIDLAEIKFR